MKWSNAMNVFKSKLFGSRSYKPETMNEHLLDRLVDTWPFVCFLRNGMVVRFGTASTYRFSDAVVLEEITAIVMPNGTKLECPRASDIHPAHSIRMCEGERLEETIRDNLFHGSRGMVVRLSDIVAICEGDS